MAVKITMVEKFCRYACINGEWGYVDFEKVYVANNWDDFQNLFATLVDFSEDGTTLKFEIKKETIGEEVDE